MPFAPFQKLCEYYLDYIIEDGTDSLSAFASGRSPTYMVSNNPELSSRENAVLNQEESDRFRILFNQQNRGNQIRSWWYGFPTEIKFITGRSGWKGGILKPLFIMNIDINNGMPSILPNTTRINNDAFRDLGLDLEQVRSLAQNLGLFSDDNYNFNLSELTTRLKELFPDFIIDELPADRSFSTLPFNDNTVIYNKGIIFSTEASKITQGLERELNRIKDSTNTQIQNSSLISFFPELTKNKLNPTQFDVSEAIELNEQQRETVLSAFKNNLTVVTGPPGTGKSQVVASIVINAAKNGQRVLVASKNHKAVDVVEDRLNQFAERPFIVRLGRHGTDDRNIQQELLQYLNGLLGTAPDQRINQELLQLQGELKELFSIWKSLTIQIEEYRVFRNSIYIYSKHWEEVIKKLGNEKANGIFNRFFLQNLNMLDRLKLLVNMDWKNINKYVKLLKESNKEIDLESLTLKLAQVELKIRKKSKDEFVLWLNDLPSRLDGTNRTTVAQYIAVLSQIIAAGDNTPRNIWARLFRDRDNLMHSLSGFLPAWCVTNLSTRGQLPLIEGFFDLVIIDEASQCDIASALPLLFRSKRAVIIGDPNQLTHISTLKTSRSLELMHTHNLSDVRYSVFEATKNSLYSLAASFSGDNKVIMLNEHFRSHVDIISYSNKTWYGGNLEIGTDYSKLNPTPDSTATVEWIDVIGNIQQIDGSGAYISSELNAVVQKVVELATVPNANYTIGVVTPFRLQANKIREALVNQLPGPIWSRTELLVDTAVKFQGDERDIMIFSPVVSSNMPKGIRYYHESEYNLLNVAITRARAKLIIIGNLNASLNCGITYIQNFARYVNELDHTVAPEAVGGQFESPYEQILYNALLRRKIQTIPQYNYDQYRLDLAYINGKKKIDIEVDGTTYHTEWTGERLKQDLIRNHKLQKKGWIILRFWAYEIRDNLDYCLERISNEIKN